METPSGETAHHEKAKPQPKWWRKRRLDKTQVGKRRRHVDAGEVEMALAERTRQRGPLSGGHGRSEGIEEAWQSCTASRNPVWLVLDEQEELEFK